MIFAKKKILVWCDDPPEDPVISIFAGCLPNHDHTHSAICECDVIGAPSIFKLTRIAAALARLLPTFAVSCVRKAARLKVKSPPLVC